MHRFRFGRRIGLVFHGQKIWISELVGIVFVAVLSLGLLALSWRIIRNERAIYRYTGSIAAGKSDRIVLAHHLEQLRERVAIAELLCSIAGNRLSSALLLELSDIVLTNSNQFGYDPLLLLAVIEVESFFLPTARGRYRSGSESGAFGLMQLKPATAQEIAAQLNMDSLTQDDLFKPEINVILGVAYLTTMISRFKSFKLGLIAYNQGPGVISKKLSENAPLPMRYYQKVLHSYYELKKKLPVDGRAALCR